MKARKEPAGRKVLEVPFLPGDDLYYVESGDKNDTGPGLFQIMRQEGGIDAVQVRTDGTALIVQEGSSEAAEPGPPWDCLDEESALAWARENKKGSLILDGRAVRARYVSKDGKTENIAFTASIYEIEDLVCSSPGTMGPDPSGIMAIYDRSKGKDDALYSVMLRDAAGHIVDIVYAPVLLVAVRLDPGTGFLEAVDMPAGGAVEGDGGAMEYDPARWTQASGMTVAMLRDFLAGFPDDAVLHCCGTDACYWHWCPGSKALSLDCESLDDLPEYQGRRPALLEGPGA